MPNSNTALYKIFSLQTILDLFMHCQITDLRLVYALLSKRRGKLSGAIMAHLYALSYYILQC